MSINNNMSINDNMSISKYIDFTQIVCQKYRILLFEVGDTYPTNLQWKFAVEEFKTNLDSLNELNVPFAFIMDFKKMCLIPTEYILEFINLLKSYCDILEGKLIATSVIYEGILISKLFEIIKYFYKTKKPLEFVTDMNKAVEFIDLNLT